MGQWGLANESIWEWDVWNGACQWGNGDLRMSQLGDETCGKWHVNGAMGTCEWVSWGMRRVESSMPNGAMVDDEWGNWEIGIGQWGTGNMAKVAGNIAIGNGAMGYRELGDGSWQMEQWGTGNMTIEYGNGE